MLSTSLSSIPNWIGGASLLITSLFSGGLGMLISKYWEHTRQKRAQTDQVALSLVETLKERVATLEQTQSREREFCDAQIAILRHRLNNALQLFEGLLMVMEAAPDKAAEYVSKIKERRAQQEQAEALEKASLMGARVTTAGVDPAE